MVLQLRINESLFCNQCPLVLCSAHSNCSVSECHLGCTGPRCDENILESPSGLIVRYLFVAVFSCLILVNIYLLFNARRFMSAKRISLQVVCLTLLLLGQASKVIWDISFSGWGVNCPWSLAVYFLPWLFFFMCMTCVMLFFLKRSNTLGDAVPVVKKRTLIAASIYLALNLLIDIFYVLFPLNPLTIAAFYLVTAAYAIAIAIGCVFIQSRIRAARVVRITTSFLTSTSSGKFSKVESLEHKLTVFTLTYWAATILYLTFFFWYVFSHARTILWQYLLCHVVFNITQAAVVTVVLWLLRPSVKRASGASSTTNGTSGYSRSASTPLGTP